MSPLPTTDPRHQGGSTNEPWHLRLYISGWTPSSVSALHTLKALQAEYLPEGSTVEVVDLIERPEAGVRDNVLAIPTLVKVSPEPVRRIVGNLSDLPKALKILGFSA
ncbi:MAG TPA: circadian clock KaiB family protein [Verrucomicrobiae bacterium]|nr:circadian clock KaiB family protein [Verrucomicrobiae bacterium]